MDTFEEQKKNFSEILLSAMKARNISVEKLVQTTGISDRFITLLIDEDFEKLPPSPYLHGYILKISETLGLDGEKIWNDFFKNAQEIRRSGSRDVFPRNRFIPSFHTYIRSKFFIPFIIGVVVLGYAFFHILSFFKTPNFSLEGIKNDMVVSNSSLHLVGAADPSDTIFLNGEQLYPDTQGRFEKDIQLTPGFNTFTFKIKRFLGKEYTVERRVFFQTTSTSTDIVPKINSFSATSSFSQEQEP